MIQRPPNLYLNYKIINKILNRSVEDIFDTNLNIKLNPNRYFLNRTQYQYCKEGVEMVEIKIDNPVLLDELINIQNCLLSNLNMILKCVELENFREVRRIELSIN